LYNYFLGYKMSDVVESRWFKVSVLIFSGVGIAYSAWQLSIASRLRSYIAKNPTQTLINPTEVNWSFWVSLVLLIASILIFIVAAYKLLFARQFREKVSKEVEEFVTTPEGGFYPGETLEVVNKDPVSGDVIVRKSPRREPVRRVSVRTPTGARSRLVETPESSGEGFGAAQSRFQSSGGASLY
jgi:hypothetical protein